MVGLSDLIFQLNILKCIFYVKEYNFIDFTKFMKMNFSENYNLNNLIIYSKSIQFKHKIKFSKTKAYNVTLKFNGL